MAGSIEGLASPIEMGDQAFLLGSAERLHLEAAHADHQSDFCDSFYGAFNLGDHFFVRFADGWHVIHYIENSHCCSPFRVMCTEA